MAVRYLFENYTFDTERRELHRGAEMNQNLILVRDRENAWNGSMNASRVW
jgi:hypothetical protein